MLILQEFHDITVSGVHAQAAPVNLIVPFLHNLQADSVQITRRIIAIVPESQANPHAFPQQGGIESKRRQTDGWLLHIGAVLHNVLDVMGKGGSVLICGKYIVANCLPSRCG